MRYVLVVYTVACRTFSSSFPSWNEKALAMKGVAMSFACFCLAPSVGRPLKQHEALKAVPESTTVKEAIESITHDDQLAAASATISQFSAMLPGCKCAAEGAVTTLSNTLHDACKSRQVSRARAARQYVKGPLFCRACNQLRIVFVLIRFVSIPFVDPPLHSQEHLRGPGGV